MDLEQTRANRRTWDAIAKSFHSTRNKPWDSVVSFAEGLPRGSRVLDAGCGNGRHARTPAFARHRVVGLDFSGSLLRLARSAGGGRAIEWVEGSLERLPLRDSTFDAVVSVAAIHHVRGAAARAETLRELLRVTRAGGRVLVSAWSKDQPRFDERPPRPPADGRRVEPGDAMVKWRHHGLDVDRFIHLFERDEWKRQVEASPGRVERVWAEAIMTKTAPDNFFAVLVKA